MRSEKSSRLADALFIVTHPLLSARAASRRFAVAIEHEAPPAGSTFEEFPELSLAEAAKLIQRAERRESGGVVWSKADNERLARGEMPQGHPEHPNI